MRSGYRVYDQEAIHFVTSTIIEWIPIFTSKVYLDLIIDSLKYCQKNQGMKLFAFVILDDHFHLIISSNNLTKSMQSLKMFTAKKIIELLTEHKKEWLLNQLAFFKKRYKINSVHQVWQEGFHPQLIIDEKMLIQKIDYIHQNPVKRGLVDKPEDWIYSSARNFCCEDNAIIEIDSLV